MKKKKKSEKRRKTEKETKCEKTERKRESARIKERKEIRETKVEDTGERERHPIDIRYHSSCIAFLCGRTDRVDLHTVWFYLWLPKLQVAGRGVAVAM